MRKKFVSVLLLFFLLSSNLSLGLMSLFSFVTDKTVYNFSNTLNIQDQYSSMFNIPKNFVNMCIKMQEDFKILKVNHDKLFFIDKNSETFNNNLLATLSSPLRLKTYYTYYECRIFDKVSDYSVGILTLFSVIFIFYILRYVGLLKLFSSHDYFITKIYGDSIALSK